MSMVVTEERTAEEIQLQWIRSFPDYARDNLKIQLM